MELTIKTKDGAEHAVSTFSTEVQNLVGGLQRLAGEKADLEYAFAKVDALNTALMHALNVKVEEELAARLDLAEDAVKEVTDAKVVEKKSSRSKKVPAEKLN